MPSFRSMTLVTIGFGQIARAVIKRAQIFGFQVAAHDPFVSATEMETSGTRSLTLAGAFAEADILCLHAPLTAATRNMVNRTSLQLMKRTAILINTARGGLIEGRALAEALREGSLFAAGLDVFDPEPLPPDDALRQAPRTILTSHISWYSEQSGPTLQRMAAAEVVRALRGETLRSQVNKLYVQTR